MAILLFREALGTDYRDVVELINPTGRIKMILHTLTKVIQSVVIVIIGEAFQQRSFRKNWTCKPT